METKVDKSNWTSTPAPDAQKEAGYDDWLKSEIEAGKAEIKAGLGIPAAEVWKELGLE